VNHQRDKSEAEESQQQQNKEPALLLIAGVHSLLKNGNRIRLGERHELQQAADDGGDHNRAHRQVVGHGLSSVAGMAPTVRAPTSGDHT
jgi:hypothetical protein